MASLTLPLFFFFTFAPGHLLCFSKMQGGFSDSMKALLDGMRRTQMTICM
jgi:hypothetical protein